MSTYNRRAVSIRVDGRGYEVASNAPGAYQSCATAQVVSTWTPARGDLFYLDDSDGLFKPADNSSPVKANVFGVVLDPPVGASAFVAGGATGGGFQYAGIGAYVPISIFGSLTALQALGNTTWAYVASSSFPGDISAKPTSTSVYVRPVFRSPKRFADLVQADYDAIWVRVGDRDVLEDGGRQVREFVSAETTSSGAAQNVAHGLGYVPRNVIVCATELPADLTGGFDVAEGSHDATNVVLTVTASCKFKVRAW